MCAILCRAGFETRADHSAVMPAEQEQLTLREETRGGGGGGYDAGAHARMELMEKTSDAKIPLSGDGAKKLLESAAALSQTNAFKRARSKGEKLNLDELVAKSLEETESQMRRANKWSLGGLGRSAKAAQKVAPS